MLEQRFRIVITVRSQNRRHRLVNETHSICLFFFNETATTEIYTLSLHDALPIYPVLQVGADHLPALEGQRADDEEPDRSEEHTSELQSRENLVCRLLLEKKK